MKVKIGVFSRYVLVVLVVLSVSAIVNAASVPNQFSPDTTISSSQVNANFNYLAERSWDLSGGNLYYNGGNVGIGTTSPGYKLHVSDNMGMDGDTFIFKSNELYGQSLFSQNSGLIDYPALWIYPKTRANNQALYIGTGATWDYSIGLRYFPGTVGAASGLLKIGQMSKNGDLYTHGITALYTNGLERLRIDKDGNVGIGTTSPTCNLHVYGNSGDTLQKIESDAASARLRIDGFIAPLIDFFHQGTQRGQMGFWGGGTTFGIRAGTGDTYPPTNNPHLVINTSGNVGIGTTTPGYTLTVEGTAWCTSGSWSGSDLRWKENIETLSDPLEKLLKLRGVTFDWKRSEFKDKKFPEGKQIGMVAQEMEKEFPELVTTDNKGYKAIAYDRFTAVLLEAIKTQQKQIGAQQKQIQDLNKRMEALEKAIAKK